MESHPIVLDHERNLRFSWQDVKEVCRALTRLEPGDQPRKVTQHRLWQLLLERDPDAITQTLFYGLRWEDRALKAERVDQILSDYIAHGGDWVAIFDAIAEGMQKSGIVRLTQATPTSDNGGSGNGARASGS